MATIRTTNRTTRTIRVDALGSGVARDMRGPVCELVRDFRGLVDHSEQLFANEAASSAGTRR